MNLTHLKKSLALLVLCLATTLTFAQNHREVSAAPPYTGKKVAVHETGPAFWVYGTGSKGKGFYRDFNGWKFVPYPSNYAEVKTFDGKYDRLVVLTESGKLRYWFSPGHWGTVEGITDIKDFSYKPNGLFVMGTRKNPNGTTETGIFKGQTNSRYARDWTPVLTGSAGSGYRKIDQDQYGNLYCVTGGGQIWKLSPPNYSRTMVSGIGTPNPIVCHEIWVLKTGTVYGTDAKTKTIHKFNNSSKSWSPLNFKSTSWGVTDKGDVYGVVHDRVECIKGGRYDRITIDNPNKMDGSGNTAITRAIRNRKSSDIGRFVANGGDVNLPDRNGDTPAIVAAKEGGSSSLRELARYKADFNKTDKSGYGPLYHAIKANNSSAAQALLDGGAKTDGKGVVETAVSERPYFVNVLARNGANLTPGLPIAAGKGDVNMFRTLLQTGARANDVSSFKKATDLGNMEIATLALDNGTNKDEALKYSLEKSNGQMIGLCLQKGAKADPAIDYVINKNDVLLAGQLVDSYGIPANTLLSKSLNGGNANTRIAEVALQRHADPNPYLDGSIKSKNREVYSLLLNHNANPTNALRTSVMENNTDFARMAIGKGGSASDPVMLKKSVESKNQEMAQMLINAGANARDPQLVRMTVNGDDMEMTRLLVNNGAPVNDPGLVMIPVKKDNYQMTELLLTNGARGTDPGLIRESVNRENVQITQLIINHGGNANDINLLTTSIDKENYEMTNLLVQSGAPADNPAAIKRSVQKDNYQISELLLTNGASAKDPQLITQSVTNNSTKVTGLLINNGADATSPNLIKKGVSHNNNGLCKLLFDNGAPGTDPALMSTSVKNNNTDLTRMIINKGGDAKPAGLIQGAVGHKNKGLVELLVDNGSDPSNGINKAVSTNQTDISVYLLDKGADASDPSLMKMSAKNGNLPIVTKLVDKGADPEDGTENAVGHGKHKVLGYLVTKGVDVKKSEYMATAVQQNHVGVFKILNDKEAPVDFVDASGNNLVHISCKHKSNEVVSALTHRGVDVNTKNNEGNTPLLIVVTDKDNKDNIDLAAILVDAGANVNAKNVKDKTVLKVAKGRKMKKYLKSMGATKKA